MTTDTNTNTAETIVNVDQLRAAVWGLLTRANDILDFKPNVETAGEYDKRLLELSEEMCEASFQLSHAATALRVLSDAAHRVFLRQNALSEVFDLETGVAGEFISEAGTLALWGEAQPVFPALGLDFTQKPIDYDSPF